MDDRSKNYLIAPPSAMYAAVLMGVTIFLLLFVLFPEPIQLYTAQVEVEQEALGTAATPSALRLSREAVESIGDEILATKASAISIPTSAAPIHFVVESDLISETKIRVRIETQARHAAEAWELSNSMAEKALANQPASVVLNEERQHSLKEDVLRRLSLTKDTERSLDDELTKLERTHLTQSLAGMQAATVAKPLQPPVASGDNALHLAWQSARARLQNLENRRVELLLSRTEAHPLVKELDHQLQDQRNTMQRLPAEVIAVEPEAGDESIMPQRVAIERQIQEFEARSKELASNRQQVRERREQLENELVRLTQPLPVVTLRTTITSPAAIVNRNGGRPSMLRLFALLVLAITFAAITYRTAHRISQERTLNSVDQVPQTLGLEVVAVIRNHRSAAPPSRAVAWLQTAVFSAEFLVALLAISVMYALGSHQEFSQPASRDPLGVIAEALDRVGESHVRR